MSDFNPEDLELLPVKEGPPGPAATVTIAAVVTVSPGTPAQVVNQGDDYNASLLIKIPRGETGEGAGDPGDLNLLFENRLLT